MMTAPLQEAARAADRGELDTAIADSVKEAAGILAEYGTGTSLGEWTDCAMDMLFDVAVYLTPEQRVDLEVLVERAVYAAAGVGGGTANHADVAHDVLCGVIR